MGKSIYAQAKIRKTKSKLLPAVTIRKCNKDSEIKRKVVNEQLRRWPERFEITQKAIDRIIIEAPITAEFLDYELLRTELLYNRMAFGFLPEEYICYELNKKNENERKEYISAKECFMCIRMMNDPAEEDVFNNKGKTYLRFKKYFQRDGLFISKPSDYESFNDYCKRNPVFVKKAVFEAMGRSVEKINMEGRDSKELFEELLSQGPHLIEELICQSEDMAALNTSSVNTVRCMTFYTRHGIRDMYYFAKIGREGSFVDNGGAGGILVGIDAESGKFNTIGFDEMNRKYEKHPDSKKKFIGYQMPEWDKLKKVCLEMSAMIPEIKFIGWDLAHTNNGWVLVEGNGMSQMIGPQTVFKRGIKQEVYKLMRDMDLIVRPKGFNN